MKLETIFTSNESYNVTYALKQKYGEHLSSKTLIKLALREIVENIRTSKLTDNGVQTQYEGRKRCHSS